MAKSLILTKKVTLDHNTLDVSFKDVECKTGEIIRYLVGFSGFKFCYADNDHHVREIGINLNTQRNGDWIHIEVGGILRDDSKHSLSLADSFVNVCVYAVAVNPVQTAGVITYSMQYFNTIFSDNDHHIKGVDAFVSVLADEKTVVGKARMYDDKYHEGTGAAYGSAIIRLIGDSLETVSGRSPDTLESSDDENYDTDEYVIFIHKFDIPKDGSDMHLKKFGLLTSRKDGKVKVDFIMEDKDGNPKASSASYEGIMIYR